MLIDTHAHVNFQSFKDDAKETIQRALDNGVWVVNVGSQIDTSRQAVEMAHQFEQGVYAVVGLHPEHTHSQYVDEEETSFKSREEIFDYEAYKKLALDPKVVGIGECGLDYYRLPTESPEGAPLGEFIEGIKAKQKAAFRAQIQLAKELNKALVIHSRPAKDDESLYDDLLEILDEGSSVSLRGVQPTKQSYKKIASDAFAMTHESASFRFEVHSFTGSPRALQKFLDRGAYVSFNGIITFDKTVNMEELVKMTPLDRIILETDSPYLTPVPYRGKRNEPLFVQHVADKIAHMKNLMLDEIYMVTTENAKRLFNI